MIISYNYAKSRVENIKYDINNNTYVFEKTNSYEPNGLGKTDGYTVSYNNNNVYQKEYVYFGTSISLNTIKDTSFIYSEEISKGSNTLFSYSYQYDSMNNIKRITSKDNSYVEYTYDIKNQLKKEFYYDNLLSYRTLTIDYVYDEFGNRLSKITTDGSGHSINESYLYEKPEWTDQLSKITITEGSTPKEIELFYDDIGNLTEDDKYTYEYEATRLTGVTPIGGNDYIRFIYNSSGIRNCKFGIDNENYWTVDYVISGDKIVRELRRDQNQESYIYYNYDENGKIFSMAISTTSLYYEGPRNYEIYFYLTNILGDVIGIVDTNGVLVETYKYDAYGNLTSEISSDIGYLNPFRYRGYYYDSETGLYSITTSSGTRYYEPEIGRYISPKPIEELNPMAINGLNLYTYGCNNPIMVNSRTERILNGIGTAASVMSNHPSTTNNINWRNVSLSVAEVASWGVSIFSSLHWLKGGYDLYKMAKLGRYLTTGGATTMSILDSSRVARQANILAAIGIGIDAYIYSEGDIFSTKFVSSAIVDTTIYFGAYQIGTIIGGLIGGPAGALIGAGVGLAIDWAIHIDWTGDGSFADWLKDGTNDNINEIIGWFN